MSRQGGSRIRRWFRGRLEADPRRWVLLLAALEGLASPWLLSSRSAPRPFEALWSLMVVVGLVLAPAGSLVAIVVQSRLLCWSGKVLRGRARPHELGAALAWAGVPVALVSWPGTARAVLRLAEAERDTIPAGLRLAQDLVHALVQIATPAVAVAGAIGCVLSVVFVAEAQGFGVWRAALNHTLAVLLGLGLLAAGIALGWWASGSNVGLPLLVVAAALAMAVRAWLGWRQSASPAV